MKQPVFVELRNLAAIDFNAFSADPQSSLPPQPSTHQLNKCLRSILDKHAPVKRCRISKRPPCTVSPDQCKKPDSLSSPRRFLNAPLSNNCTTLAVVFLANQRSHSSQRFTFFFCFFFSRWNPWKVFRLLQWKDLYFSCQA